MALVVDPDLLADSAADDASQEVYISQSAKTVKLVVVGNLSTDGVTGKCLYSFLKEQWRLDPNSKNLAAFPFPMVPITDESFEFVDGWDFVADASRYLIRTAGWTVKNTSSAVTQKWAGIIGLGTIESNDQLYFEQGAGATNAQLTGQINQAVQILSDPNGDGNYADGYNRTTAFALFGREYAQVYGKAALTNIGVTTMDSIAYRFPISTATDLNITHTDGTVGGANDPYQKIKLRYFSTAFSRDVDSATDRSFGIVIDVGTHSGVDGSMTASGASLTTTAGGVPTDGTFDGGVLTVHEGTNAGTYTIGTVVSATAVPITTTFSATESSSSFTLQRVTPVVATAEEIYELVQYKLRQNSNINSTGASVTGKTADELLTFVGSDLKCGLSTPSNPNGGGSGVIIEGFKTADTNRLAFYDNGAVVRTYPFVAALTINFGDNLKNDASAKYWAYFTYTHQLASNSFAIVSASGQNANLTSMGGAVSLEQILSGEQFLVSGFTWANNNGMYEATAGGTTSTVAVKKADSGDGDYLNVAASAPVKTISMNPFGSISGIIVDDNSVADIAGNVSGNMSFEKSFNYDGNVQGGRTAAVDAPITVVGIGLSTGQYVKATGTILRSITNSITLTAPFERNYSNP